MLCAGVYVSTFHPENLRADAGRCYYCPANANRQQFVLFFYFFCQVSAVMRNLLWPRCSFNALTESARMCSVELYI